MIDDDFDTTTKYILHAVYVPFCIPAGFRPFVLGIAKLNCKSEILHSTLTQPCSPARRICHRSHPHLPRASFHHIHLQSPDPLAQARQPTTAVGRFLVACQPNTICAMYNGRAAKAPTPAQNSAPALKILCRSSSSVAAILSTNASPAVIS